MQEFEANLIPDPRLTLPAGRRWRKLAAAHCATVPCRNDGERLLDR
jgi:hypothetical protein